MSDEPIRVHSVPQEYWYLSRTPCDCGGKFEMVQQETGRSDRGPCDRLTVKCDDCGRGRVFVFDVSSFIGQGSETPLTQIVEFVNWLSNDRDVLAIDYLQALLDTARSALAHQTHNAVLHEFGGLDGIEDRLAAEEAAQLRLLAERGDAEAQCGLGWMYVEGDGVPQDDAEAVRWYRLAADQGHAPAQANLGKMYAIGAGVQQDDAVAVQWLQLAADQRMGIAQHDLGEMVADGLGGLPQSAVTGWMWLTLACSELPELTDNEEASGIRERIKQRMSAEELVEGERLAREWDAAHPREP